MCLPHPNFLDSSRTEGHFRPNHPRMADSFAVHRFEYVHPTWNLGDNPRMDLYDPGSWRRRRDDVRRPLLQDEEDNRIRIQLPTVRPRSVVYTHPIPIIQTSTSAVTALYLEMKKDSKCTMSVTRVQECVRHPHVRRPHREIITPPQRCNPTVLIRKLWERKRQKQKPKGQGNTKAKPKAKTKPKAKPFPRDQAASGGNRPTQTAGSTANSWPGT